MPKQAPMIVLSEPEEQGLLQITRRHRESAAVVLRAHIVLAAARGCSNARIVRELHVCVDTVHLWRDRWAGLQGIDVETLSLGERLQDAPRPGATPKFTTEQRCQMAALACEAPSQAGRPISQWTGWEIADDTPGMGHCRAHLASACSAPAEIWGLQPHRFRYWLTAVPDEQRDEKIREGVRCTPKPQSAPHTANGP